MPSVFIAGCGFAGLTTARLFHARGWRVVGATHSKESAAQLAGEPFRVTPLDIADRARLTQREAAEALLSAGARCDVAIHCASSGRGGAEEYRRVYLEGARNLIEVMQPRLLIFASSTSVYAQTDGSIVMETSATKPDRETGRILREAEELVIASDGCVVRLAGIYGPGRSVLLKKFFSGEAAIESDGSRWINQVHRDDIASALVLLGEQFILFPERVKRGIFNVVDDMPIAQRELYAWLAQRFGKPLPPSAPIDLNRKRGWTHKRVSNAKLRALGWTPQYPSFFDAVDKDPALLQSLRP